MNSTDDSSSTDTFTLTTPSPAWAAKRPLRIALLGDFSAGALRGRLETGAALARRKPLNVEFDTLDDALARLDVSLRLPIGEEGAAVEVPVTELESFHPDELYRNVELFSALAGLRKRLNAPSTQAAAAAEVRAWADPTRLRASSVSARSRSGGATLHADAGLSDFARLTGRPNVDAADGGDISALLRRVVGPFVVPAASPDKDALVAAVDDALADAMRAVLQQPDFQNAESLWRGADFLLRRLETGPRLQVHLIDLSAEEFAADLSGVADLADSGLYQLLVGQPAQAADGGYAYVAGCYRFEATPAQAGLLGRMAQVAAHAGAPFLTAIDTDVFTDHREPPPPEVAQAFEALRALPNAAWLGLFGPRFLLRHPYGKRSDPIASFAFEEFSRSAGLRGMLWGHPALLALSVLGRAGAELAIGDLPFHHYVDDDGDTLALPCTDRLVGTRAGSLLRDWGINGVMAHKGEPLVRLTGLQAVDDTALRPDAGGARKAAADTRAGITMNVRTHVLTAPSASQLAPAGDGEPPAAPETSADAAVETTAAADPAADEDSMDPELAALLKSLG